jgi:hypothetical protein
VRICKLLGYLDLGVCTSYPAKVKLLAFVGAISANSSLGSQWKDRIEGAVTAVQAAMPQPPPRPIFKMNLKLTVS